MQCIPTEVSEAYWVRPALGEIPGRVRFHEVCLRTKLQAIPNRWPLLFMAKSSISMGCSPSVCLLPTEFNSL